MGGGGLLSCPSLPRAVADPRPPSHLAPQDQLKQLQEILGSLSLQEEKTRVSRHHLDQQLNNEAQQSSSLVAQLRATVAEREAKVRQLEVEIGQLSMQVSRALAQPSIHSHVLASPSGIQRNLSHLHFSPPAFTWAAPHPTWSHFGSLLPSGSLAHCAHTFPLEGTHQIVSLLHIKPVCGSPSPSASLKPQGFGLLPAHPLPPQLWPSSSWSKMVATVPAFTSTFQAVGWQKGSHAPSSSLQGAM